MSSARSNRLRLVPSPPAAVAESATEPPPPSQPRSKHREQSRAKRSQRTAFDDSTLLTGMKKRSPEVAAAFYDRVRPVIDRTLSKLLGPGDLEYEDTAQMALFELISTLHRFRGDCPLDAWVSIVTARVVYRQIRRRQRDRSLFAPTPPDEEIGPQSYFRANSLVLRQALTRVRVHLERMDEARAWTFLLHDVYGYDLRETSQIMGVSLSAAQSRLVRGRREIHERIRRDPALAQSLEDLTEVA